MSSAATLLAASALAVILFFQGISSATEPTDVENSSSSSLFGSDGGPEAEGDPEFGAFGLPQLLRDDEPTTDPSLFDDASEVLPERYLIRSVPWRAPDFSNQTGALGWKPDVFETPAILSKRVQFWKDIYAKYTTDQGVLHDLDDITVVYEAIDFNSIMKNQELSLSQKAKARTRLVDSRRKEIRERLERLAKMKSTADIRDARDAELVAFFTPTPIAELFAAEKKKEIEGIKARMKSASSKRRVRFQLGQRDKFILGVYYSGRYLRQMEKIFRAENLPIELTRLPFVESSFNIKARSRVGASGVWQFMPRTAKPWMMVNRDVDERNDPITATEAAARLMKSNFDRLQSWPLALTAYNHGAAGVSRAVRKTGSTDLAVIIEKYESRRFGFASSNFFACFLAALEVERDARKTLGDVKWSLEFDGIEIDLLKPLAWKTVIDFYDSEKPLAELQNPHLSERVKRKDRTIPSGTFIRVPAPRAEIIQEYLKGLIGEEELKVRLAVVPMPRTQTSGTGAAASIRSKLGSIAEAVRSLIPLLMPDPSPTPESPAPGVNE